MRELDLLAAEKLSPSVVTPYLGEIASAAALPTYTTELCRQRVETNLPQVFITGEGSIFADSLWSGPTTVPLIPDRLDSLPTGNFFVRTPDPFGHQTDVRTRPITVIETPFGKAIGHEAWTKTWDFTPGAEELMAALGFIAREGKTTAIPTPESLAKAAAKLGIALRLLPQYGHISDKDFMSTYLAGEHPIATGKEDDYWHDSDDDHLIAVVLGGSTLRDALKVYAAKNMWSAATLSSATRNIDGFTSTLRGIISPNKHMKYTSFLPNRGRRTLTAMGKTMGMDVETVNEIIATAQANAREYGMETPKLA